MKIVVVILIFLSTFTVRNNYLHNEQLQKINEPRDGRAVESTASTHIHYVDCFAATHPACSKLNRFVMRNNPQSRKAKGAFLVQTEIPSVAFYAAAISTDGGFYKEYFNILQDFSSRKDAFDAVNVDHYLLHGRLRFSSFHEFRTMFFKVEELV